MAFTPSLSFRSGWSLIVAANDPDVLHGTLLGSPAIDEHCEVIIREGYLSAGEAYNTSIRQVTHELMVFAHQDVYLPEDWMERLTWAIGRLEQVDPDWGVLGIFGVNCDLERKGHVYSTGLGRVLGADFKGIHEAVSLDEMVLVMRRSANIFFDEGLPGFHFYGTDICLEARRRGMRSYIVPAFCIHNSNGIRYFPLSFWRAYLYMRNKWWPQLPLQTCCTRITRSGWPFAKEWVISYLRNLIQPGRVGLRSPHPERLYRDLLDSGQHQARTV